MNLKKGVGIDRRKETIKIMHLPAVHVANLGQVAS